MNQRFQNAEIKLVSERYADNELYKAVNKIGAQLESELTEFGLCPEECFMEAVEMLSVIADKGKDVLPDLENLWLRKYNEYGRFDRSVDKDEIRKAIGIVLGFVILAVDSSTHPFYRRTLTEEITVLIANHKFEGWAKTLFQIASVPLPDGWFDAFISQAAEESDKLPLPKTLDTSRAQRYFKKAIEAKYLKYNSSQYKWIGTNNKGSISELAYFCGKIYNYKNTVSGNMGESFPEEELNKLFNVKRLYSSLAQVYNAQKPQRWRSQIDAIFE